MIFIDAHVHIYDCYSLNDVLERLSQNLCRFSRPSTDTSYACCLTERAECHFFNQLVEQTLALPPPWSITPNQDAYCHLLHNDETDTNLFCFAGRQINTAERLEVAALLFHDIIPDGTPIRTVIPMILAQRGIPVLNWAFGKWLFKRGALIHQLINEFGSSMVLCDSALRPYGWPTPTAFKQANKQDIALIAGTDPLPCAGEERIMGSYGSYIHGTLDQAAPSNSLQQLLMDPAIEKEQRGHRSSWPHAIYRQIRYYKTGC